MKWEREGAGPQARTRTLDAGSATALYVCCVLELTNHKTKTVVHLKKMNRLVKQSNFSKKEN